MNRLSDDKRKKGCPTCGGIDPKTCMRCYGKTRMYDWVKDGESYDYAPGNAQQTVQADPADSLTQC